MKINIKSQKGITGIEITVAIVMLTIFVSLISTIFINIYLNSTEAQRNTVATGYATQIAEMIDKMYYADVEEDTLSEKIEEINIPSGYTVTANVENYTPNANSKDLVKTITVTVTYKVGNNEKNVQIERIKAKEVLITPNRPKLSKGMVPVKYVTTDEISGQGYWEITTEDDSTWYNYSNRRWANVMLQDDLIVEGNIKVTNENIKNLAGKKITTLGSMFVWIPRYAYKIPQGNSHTSTAGEIDIIFLYSTSNNYIDENGNMVPISNKQGYKIHPSFQDGTENNYANGEWDKELTGYWVAKFEASSTKPNGGGSYGGGNDTSLNIKVVPNVTSWRNISVANIYTVCKKMTIQQNRYGLSQEANSHLIKNSEWGAVAYLAQSKYGNIQKTTDSNSGVWNNSYYNGDGYYTNKTGVAGQSRDESSSSGSTITNVNSYNTINGQKSSTTRNIYGIYDMAGGSWDYTMSYIGEIDFDVPLKESQKYAKSSSDTGTTNFQANSSVYGDAIWETSANGAGDTTLSWNSDYSYFATGSYSFILRGGAYSGGANIGIFGYSRDVKSGGAYFGFRVVITVE